MKKRGYVVSSLPYEYDALEPYIDEETMIYHHTKHHKAYVDKLNEALQEFPELQGQPLQELLASVEYLPIDIRDKVKNNGGGHFNHSFFWACLSPRKQAPKGQLLKALEAKFGNVKNFKNEFIRVAVEHFGSGYTWLCTDEDSRLVLYSLPDQETPFHLGLEPILLLDVWEHAYYLKYKNDRPHYVKAIWNCINWTMVENNFLSSLYESRRPEPLQLGIGENYLSHADA